ncbi:MAG TPA: YihY/virulence factor BrkB family protein [Bryobacteraceae bacterium]
MCRGVWRLCKQTISRWIDHEGPRHGAALAFYALLSLAPLVILVVAGLSTIFGKKAVQDELIYDVTLLMDKTAATTIKGLLAIARKPPHGLMSSLLGALTLLFGASAVFSELTDTLNKMWGGVPKYTGLHGLLRDRVLSFVLVAGAGLLIAVSMVASATVTAVHSMFGSMAPAPMLILEVLNFFISLGATTFLFAIIFRFVPNVTLPWRTVAIGAAVSALLFVTGKAILGAYLNWAGIGSAYGAAGSLVAVLVWVYYSAQIFYLGAEFTCVCGQVKNSSPVQENRSATPSFDDKMWIGRSTAQ